jgi:SAM-dependent methyltransferase
MAGLDGRDSNRIPIFPSPAGGRSKVIARLRPTLGRLGRGLARRMGLASPPPAPAPPGRAGGPVAGLDLDECQLFFGYLRIHAYAMLADVERHSHEALRAGLSVALEVDGAQPAQRASILSVQPGGAVEFEIDALVPRDLSIDRVHLLAMFGGGVSRFEMRAVLPFSRARDVRTMLTGFREQVAQAAASGQRPRLLDVGGRARSRIQKSEDYPHCDVTVFDIIADPGVDVVGDAHELSAHFPPGSFDFAISLAVFEHLLMPWKVAVEMNRVLKPGGLAYVWAPQSHSTHDMPWDFFRFSDAAWHALFNRRTGFEVVATDMSMQVHIVPRVLPEQPADPEHTMGYMSSEVLVRKIGLAEVDWPVKLSEVIDTMYPTQTEGEAMPGGERP